MALSKPQLGIQSPIQCQLCERDPKISWKCFECDLLMCNECNSNIHPKIKTTGEHKIVAIKDIGCSPSVVPSKVDMTLVKTYTTKLEEVCVLAISSDGSLWISDGYSKKRIRLFSSHTGLQKVKCEGNKMKVISSFNTVIHDFAVTPGDDLIMVTDGSKLIQIKSGTKKVVDTVYNVEPYEPVSIHVTKKYKVIVGVSLGTEKGKVIVMDQEGNREKVYGEDHTKRISMIYPNKITATSNDNIFVIDDVKDETKEIKRVVVLANEDTINTYCGHSFTNTEDNPFNPYDLTTTPSDYVIVLDLEDTLHILNSSGQLMTYINTEDKGLSLPCSMGLAMEDQSCILYIGTFEDEGKDAKIYKFNLRGF